MTYFLNETARENEVGYSNGGFYQTQSVPIMAHCVQNS